MSDGSTEIEQAVERAIKRTKMRDSPFRLFQLTINVYVPSHWSRLPGTFVEWRDVAFGTDDSMELPSTPTTLERIQELRYPLANDVIEKRGDKNDRRYW